MYAFNPSTQRQRQRQRQVDPCEFEASLVYRWSSRVTQRNSVSKNGEKRKKKKNMTGILQRSPAEGASRTRAASQPSAP